MDFQLIFFPKAFLNQLKPCSYIEVALEVLIPCPGMCPLIFALRGS